jgi:hypothetical protein
MTNDNVLRSLLDCQNKKEGWKLHNFTTGSIIYVRIKWIFKFGNCNWTNVNCFALWQDGFGRPVYWIIIRLAQRNEFNSGRILLPYFCPLLIQIKTRTVDRNSQYDSFLLHYATIESGRSWEILSRISNAKKRDVFCMRIPCVSIVIHKRMATSTQAVYSLIILFSLFWSQWKALIFLSTVPKHL